MKKPSAPASAASKSERHSSERAAARSRVRALFGDSFAHTARFRDWQEWDDVAATIPLDLLPTDVTLARELEALVVAWRRSLERSFVYGFDRLGIDPARDTKVARDMVETLHPKVMSRVGGASNPVEAIARRRRVAMMRYLDYVVEQGFTEWPDLDALEEVRRAEAVSVDEPSRRGRRESPLLRKSSRKSAEEMRKWLPTGLDPAGFRVFVDLENMRTYFEELPIELRDGLRRASRAALDKLVASWSETRSGGHNPVSKYEWLRRVLRRAVDDPITRVKLQMECKRQKKGATRVPL